MFWELPLAASPWPVQVVVIVILAVVGVSLSWWLVVKQNKSTGMDFRNDWWPELKKGNMAVAIYRVGVLLVVFGTVAYLLGRFA